MATSPTTVHPADAPGAQADAGSGLRLALHRGPHRLDGAWWPRSRVLATEAAALVDGFPPAAGRISRLLFSRPDWDDALTEGRGARRIQAARGPVKVGSFPSDDTHLMVLSMSDGRRLRLVVVPSGVPRADGERRMREVAEHGVPEGADADRARWDHETPGR